MGDARQRVALVWHMHQPNYVWPPSGEPLLPWVRLHAAKSYSDMAGALERNPGMRCTVNFSGVLIQQIEAAAAGLRDMHWGLTMKPAESLSVEERALVVHHFFSLNWDRLVRPHPRYAELLAAREHGADAFDTEAIRDLQVLFNLQWCGWWLREQRPELDELLARGAGFSEDDKRAVLDAHDHALQCLQTRWRALVARGQVEVSFTPMYHPILPLLIDTDHGRRCLPDHPMPPRYLAPDWARRQVEMGRAVVSAWIGRTVDGAWPAEGSVSPEAAAIFSEVGVRWIASDEDVLRQSDRSADFQRNGWWQCETGRRSVAGLFRDHELSDAIGFSYASMDAASAVEDFCRRASERRQGDGAGVRVVILDGENPWEAYPDDGEAFLCGLFAALGGDGRAAGVTVSEAIDGEPAVGVVKRLHTGSWINGDFHIWIGSRAKNDAWALLAGATQVAGDVPESADSLMSAQGSDWFWWYGDNFHSQNDDDFDALFRAHCGRIYDAAGEPHPAALGVPVDGGSGPDGAVQPTSEIHPTVDGRVSHYYEWHGAGVLRQASGQGAMHRVARVASVVLYGYSAGRVHLRLDAMAGSRLGACSIELFASGAVEPFYRQTLVRGEVVETETSRAAVADLAEWSVSVPSGLAMPLELVVEARSADGLAERLPALGRWVLAAGVDAERWWIV